MAKDRDFAGEPRSEALKELRIIPEGGYERSIGKAGGEKGLEKRVRDTDKPTKSDDGTAARMPKSR
jgi:hypothetical protein